MSFREVRIRLTSQCNYKCTFCHDDGGAHCQVNAKPDTAKMLALIENLRERGYTDFTLTGGEPLVNREALFAVLKLFSKPRAGESLTLITNGSLLDEEVVAVLAECPIVRVNISLHTVNIAEYQQITGQCKTTPQHIQQACALLWRQELPFKLNAVVASNFVGSERLQQLLDFARVSGASHLKLIERMVVPGEPCEGNPVLEFAALKQYFERNSHVVKATPRTTTYCLESGQLVELTRCSCSVGCQQCYVLGAHTFTGGELYHPCAMSATVLDLKVLSLEEALHRGAKMVRSKAEHYATIAKVG